MANAIMTAKKYTGYIYMIYNDINKKVYIGETLQSIATRFKQHITKAYDSNRKYDGHLFRAIRKYGKEHFFIKEIDRIIGCDKNQVKKEIQNLEVQYIKKYDSFKNGYNCDSGGGKGAKLPDLETRHKQSLAKLSHPEYIQKAKNNLKKAIRKFIALKEDVKAADDEIKHRDVRELELREISILDDTKIPAYDGTSIETRAETFEDFIEIRMTNDEVQVKDESSKYKEPFNNHEWHNRYMATRANLQLALLFCK